MKKLILTLMLGIFLFSFASAEINSYGDYVTKDCVNLRQVCATCTYVNISVYYPNSTSALVNQPMNNIGGGNWNYEFCETEERGRYDVNGVGDIDGSENSFDTLYFNISPTGKEFTVGKSITYLIILLLSIAIFLSLIWFGSKIKTDYPKDARTGYIIGLNNTKYLKYLSYALSYVCLIWISYFTWMITYAYLDFTFLSNIFRFIFVFFVALTLPLFILYIWIQIANLIRDSKIKEALTLGSFKE